MELEKLKDMLYNAAGGPVGIQMCHEAADAIEQLQTKNEELSAKLDAAIKQLHGHCYACAYNTSSHNQGSCSECKYEYYLYPCDAIKDNWKWRGPEEDQHGTSYKTRW